MTQCVNIKILFFFSISGRITHEFNFTKKRMLGTNIYSRLVIHWNISYPVKGHPPGKGLYIAFSRSRFDFDTGGTHEIYDFVVPHRDYNGIELYFHDPYEVITEQTLVRHVRGQSKFSVIPKIHTIDTTMSDFYVQEYAIKRIRSCS